MTEFIITDAEGQYQRCVQGWTALQAAEAYAEKMHGEFDYPPEMDLLVQAPGSLAHPVRVTIESRPCYRADYVEPPKAHPEAPSETNRIRLYRRSGGVSGNKRPLYAWEWRYPCGARGCSNMNKRYTTSHALDHLRKHNLPRSKRYVEN